MSLRRDLALIHLPLFAAAAISIVAGLALGRVGVPVGQTLRVLGHELGLAERTAADLRVAPILIEVRLPRVLLAAIVGGALALAGCLMQGLFRNPLADPGILGVSSGAALGAVVALHLGWAATSIYALPVAAFVTGLASALAVYLIAGLSARPGTGTLLLAGIAIASLAGAITSLFLFLTRDYALREIVFWMMGGLSGATGSKVAAGGTVALAAWIASSLFARDLNAILMGEEAAASVGVPVGATRLTLLVFASVLTAAAVAVGGIIGFVGLVVPHVLRLAIGPDHRRLLIASVPAGAGFLVVADLASRTLSEATEIPLGIVTALAGAPFFVYLLVARPRGANRTTR